MTTISDIYIYPVKSCGGVRVTGATITPTGLALDRHWMIVDGDGMFVTQREQPRLALLRPTLHDGGVTLAAEGYASLDLSTAEVEGSFDVVIFGETIPARGVGRAADAWISNYLGAPHRIVAQDPSFLRKGGVQYPSRDDAPTSFVDNFGVLVVSQASLDDLNRRMDKPLPVNRFRPNIVVSGVSAYDEDFFATASAGDVELRFVDLCYRCNLTTIDQDAAEFGTEPLATLTAYRKTEPGVKFGNYAAIAKGFGDRLKVGQQLQVTLNF